MKLIPLSKRGKHKGKYFAQVDDEDFECVNKFNWSVSISPYTQYAARANPNGGAKIKMHRQIMNIHDPNILIDHENHNGLDCQKNNMRIADRITNGQNRNTNSTKRYKGVFFLKQKYTLADKTIKYTERWLSLIRHNKTLITIGRFKNEKEAAIAYDNKAKELFGEFAKLNFK